MLSPNAPASTSRRPRRVVESESDDERASRSSQGGTPFSETTPDGNKRARLNHDEDSESNNENDEDASPLTQTQEPPTQSQSQTQTQTPRPRFSATVRSPNASSRNITNGLPPQTQNTAAVAQQSSGGGPDEHRAGAIVRVKLKDFVTYTSAEFFPGPRLNMVIGPNGTGKSTLVCAICLGLGWGPQFLGRAKEPAEFVKHGCDEATIEIELAGGDRFRRNPVISRTIKRDGNKSTFSLNGKQCTRQKVQDLAKLFSIQIDNLCQFLPQDKVSEFAALSPVELLHSTQRAAAGPEMIELHDNLKTLRAEQKRVQRTTVDERDSLSNLEHRQETQRDDVERMRQRGEIKKRIEFLEMARPLARYKECRPEFKKQKERYKTLTGEQRELESQLAPVLQAVEGKKEYHTKIEAALKQKKHLVTRGDDLAKEESAKMGKAEDQLKDLESQINAEKKSVTADLDGYKKVQQAINKVKRQIEEGQVDFDPAEYSEKIRDCARQLREIAGKAGDLQDRKREIAKSYSQKRGEVIESETHLQNLASQTGQQEEKVKKMSPETHKAWKWVKAHQDRFEQRVYGPPLIECAVTDPKYADALESLMQRNDFLAFTTQTRADFRTLQRAVSSEMHLHDVTIKTCSTPLSQLNPPVSDEELRSLGFDGWAKDFLSGPEPVLAMLCSDNRMHQTPLVLREISDDEYRKMENSQISTWVSGRQSYQVIRRREYGPSATSTRVRQLRPARGWTDQPVDSSTTHELENKIRDGKHELESIQATMDEQKASLARLEEKHKSLTKERNELEHEKSVKQTAHTNYNALPTKLAQQQEKLQSASGRIQAVRERIEGLRNQQDEVCLEKAASAVAYAASVERLRKLHEDLIRAEIKYVEATSDYETLKERDSDVHRTLEEKNSEVDESAETLTHATENYKKTRKEVEALTKRADELPGLNDVLIAVKAHSIAHLEADIDSEKARLELTGEGSSNIIKEFEARQQKIDKSKEQLAGLQQRLNALELGIAEVRGQWEPRLDALIQKLSDAFSDSFNRIGCAGQISVDKLNDDANESGQTGNDNGSGGSDFDQWSIKIEVKFRENESLSVLDSHRQSGGERAVSTIFYLMALQSLSASPFRVVDEINQGMDPRNERMVHERMVDIACGQADSEDSGGQYFLITPKLLSGLVYKRGMKVLCIVSGEYMPEDYSKVDFQRCALRMKDVVKERARRKGKGKEKMVGGGHHVGIEA